MMRTPCLLSFLLFYMQRVLVSQLSGTLFQLHATGPVTMTASMCANTEQPLATPAYECGTPDSGAGSPEKPSQSGNNAQAVAPAIIMAATAILVAALV